MYIVVNASTGIVAARFLSKKFAQQWLEDNNFDENGQSLGLYRMVKVKEAHRSV